MRALRDMNLPKFVFEDVPLFLGLIADLFPGLDCPRVRYPNFNDAVEAVLQDNKYILLPHQVFQKNFDMILHPRECLSNTDNSKNNNTNKQTALVMYGITNDTRNFWSTNYIFDSQKISPRSILDF